MAEVADFLYKLTPLILGIFALVVVPPSDRAKRRRQPDPAETEVEVIQGQPVDLTGERVRALENDLLQEREIARLQHLLIRNRIDYEETPDGHEQPDSPGTGS